MAHTSITSPLLVCLTGGIATGKSRVEQFLANQGWVTICTDRLVHELYGTDVALVEEIVKHFGPSVRAADGGINRSELALKVFSDASSLQQLNALVHPKVRLQWQQRSLESIKKGKRTLVVIPLAYETQLEREFKETWVVACSAQEQKIRMEQRGLSALEIEQRLGSQWPLQKKIDLADRVIWNNGSWDVTQEQLQRIGRN